jgi:hypothetical protein
LKLVQRVRDMQTALTKRFKMSPIPVGGDALDS